MKNCSFILKAQTKTFMDRLELPRVIFVTGLIKEEGVGYQNLTEEETAQAEEGGPNEEGEGGV